MVTILMPISKLLQTLDPHPVLAVPLGNVSLLRLDLVDTAAPGNKWFKLQAIVRQTRDERRGRLVSFGGAWSNHLHALAAVGAQEGLATVGIVRGDDGLALTPTLRDCRDWGMELMFVSRQEYRRRHDPDYLAQLAASFGQCRVIPEGGGSVDGVMGCIDIGRLLSGSPTKPGKVVVAVGTGTTLAGIAIGLGPDWEVVGVAALRGASDLEARIRGAIDNTGAPGPVAAWSLLHDYHSGGFARVNPALKAFILEFEAVQGVQLDPVYSAKALFAVHTLRETGAWDAREPITVIHTGGLQGRRGYDWLS